MNRFYFYGIMTILLILTLSALTFAGNRDEEARKYIVRGMAAIEMAKSESGLAIAVAEFKKATEIAPDMAAAWYNLGSVQSKTGNFKDAIASYRRYLSLAPQSEDARRIKDEIFKLEFRLEQTDKLKSLGGTWIDENGSLFRLSVADGNRMMLQTEDYQIPMAEFIPAFCNRGPQIYVKLKYLFELQGDRITGTWQRDTFKDYLCPIPEDSGELTGVLREADRMLALRYTFTGYRADIKCFLIGDDYCIGVSVTDKKEIEKKIFGPLPQGGIGVDIRGIYPGVGKWPENGWAIHPKVGSIQENSPAYAAGLREGDEIIAIDGAAVKSLSARDVIIKLRGEPGTEVVLSVKRGQDIRLCRVALTGQQ